MNIRHLQLNTHVLRSAEAVAKFVTDEKIDIACFQEISSPDVKNDPLQQLLEKAGYAYAGGPSYLVKKRLQWFGVSIASRWPIVDFHCNYYNSPSFGPEDQENLLQSELKNPDTNFFKASRAIETSIRPRCILTVCIQTDAGLIRVVTAHYPVSDACTEMPQMYEMSKMISANIQYAKSMPTIFSGDLNVQAQSYSVAKLKEVLTCHTEDLTDTLSPDHGSKTNEYPKGLAVDHVFSKGLQHSSTVAKVVPFSDHQAVISEFSL